MNTNSPSPDGSPLWLCSMQPSMLYARKNNLLPCSKDDLKVGEAYCGYVSHIQPYGAFVSFVGGLRGLTRINQLATHFVANTSDVVCVGQCVYVSVKKVEEDKIDLSMKVAVPDALEKVLMVEYEEQALRVMEEGSLEEEMSEEEESSDEDDDVDKLMEEEEKKDDDAMEEEKEDDAMDVEESEESGDEKGDMPTLDWHNVRLGAVLKGHIKTVRPYGVLVELEGGAVGFAQGAVHTEGVECKEGAEVTARVLDLNASLQLLDVTLNAKFMTAETNRRQRNRRLSDCTEGLAVGQKTEGVIVAKKSEYLVVCLTNHGNQLCLCSTAGLNSVKEPFVGGEVGDTVSVKVVSEPNVGEEVMACRRCVKEVKAEDASAMQAFFDTTRVGVLVNDVLNTRLQMEKQQALEVLDDRLVGQVLRVTVREVQATRLFVVLNNVKTEHKYRADVMKCDVEEADWPKIEKGAELTAK